MILRIHRLLHRLWSQRATLHLRLQVPGSPGGRTSNQVRESSVTPEILVSGPELGGLPTGLKILLHTRRSRFGLSDVRMVRD